MNQIFLVVSCILLLQISHYVSSSNVCTSSGDCRDDECCAIAGSRHSMPECVPMRMRGEPCRVGNEPYKEKVFYDSDGTSIQTKEVYRNLCPCGKDLKCTMGECMQRYSIPQCQKFPKNGEFCRNGDPEDMTLYYPNGLIKETKGLHKLFCPCDAGLTCKSAKCTKEHENNLNRMASRKWSYGE